ncbi:type II toxin-antitoxin system HicA family toxin [Enterococcus entomosocium]|uniref:type II toxin-antitoxin system HicA family toxin n=1 Tax=Enterococcus entomosocium TaxID=3034352 RepID=UPI003D6C3517
MVKTGKELLKLAKKNGWELVRVSGSHHRLRNLKTNEKVTIAIHSNKDIPIGTEKEIMKKLGLK